MTQAVEGPLPGTCEELVLGTVVSRYVVLGEVGRGGMGRVSLANDPKYVPGQTLQRWLYERARATAISSGSVTARTMRMGPSQRGHTVTSTSKTRASSEVHAMREGVVPGGEVLAAGQLGVGVHDEQGQLVRRAVQRLGIRGDALSEVVAGPC